jgi:hypothetical protein
MLASLTTHAAPVPDGRPCARRHRPNPVNRRCPAQGRVGVDLQDPGPIHVASAQRRGSGPVLLFLALLAAHAGRRPRLSRLLRCRMIEQKGNELRAQCSNTASRGLEQRQSLDASLARQGVKERTRRRQERGATSGRHAVIQESCGTVISFFRNSQSDGRGVNDGRRPALLRTWPWRLRMGRFVGLLRSSTDS